jgi:NADP-dependent 3-hydroxy acid dehydrogenase YdfG
MSNPQVWLITGTSSGFGAAFVKNLLERGDKVIATARTLSKIAHLEELGAAILQLDVTNSPAELEKAAKKAIEIYGKIDVLVNNAGYAHFGTFEDAT